MDFDKSKMRATFRQRQVERERIEAKLKPLHDELTELRRSTAKREAELAEKIKKTREPLVAIDTEMGMISRALSGKTGEPAEEEAATA